jgi:GAF domain-containing protein
MERINAMNIPVPKNEAKRIQVLWQYDILDTVPEEVFDELANLAGLICGAPIALITLVDENRQWFKAKVGVTLNETQRDISLCTHAIMQTDLFVIPDTTLDARFKNNPLVTEGPKIRFYAGAPLVTPDGHALGTLCVVDKVPRNLNENQLQALRVLARHVMIQLELRRHAKELVAVREDCTQTKADLAKAKLEIARLKKGKTPVKKVVKKTRVLKKKAGGRRR